MHQEPIETHIQTLGEAKIPSPMLDEKRGGIHHLFVSDEDRIMINIRRADIQAMVDQGVDPPSFELAGPRRKVYFDASKLRCAIATCGGGAACWWVPSWPTSSRSLCLPDTRMTF